MKLRRHRAPRRLKFSLTTRSPPRRERRQTLARTPSQLQRQSPHHFQPSPSSLNSKVSRTSRDNKPPDPAFLCPVAAPQRVAEEVTTLPQASDQSAVPRKEVQEPQEVDEVVLEEAEAA